MNAESNEQPGALFTHGRTGLVGNRLGPVFQPHSPTSRAAAQAIEPHAGTMREAVWALFAARGWTGLTDEEGYVLLEMSPSTYRPRRVELEKAGRVRDSGRTRHTASGRKAVVWVSAGP